MHGFISREGLPPMELRRLARQELHRLPTVKYLNATVTHAERSAGNRFRVSVGPRRRVESRKLLIATGVMDHLPAIVGIEDFYGRSVFQCPYCDGYEMRGKALAVYGRRQRGFEMSRALTAWSHDIVLCSDGPSGLSTQDRDKLRRNGISLREERILRLDGRAGKLEKIVFRLGEPVARTALFFDTPSSGQSRLAESLGCRFTRNGGIRCGRYEATSVPGVFVAGNIIRDVQLSIVAAAEGARAAFGINRALIREDFERRATGRRIVEHSSEWAEGTPVRQG
jgi:thioredoxin reductase